MASESGLRAIRETVAGDVMPRVGVMGSRGWEGARRLSDEVRPLLVVPWDTVWTRTFATDAHLVTYYADGAGQSRYPRCCKEVLPRLRERGADLLTRLMVLDYDRPGHAPWESQAEAEEWSAELEVLGARWPLARSWSVLYTTRNGARLVFVLDDPLPVDEAEGRHRWLVQQFREQGVWVDGIDADGLLDGEPAKKRYPTSDWTHLFRMPFVVRDGSATWEDDVKVFAEQEGLLLETSSLGDLPHDHRGRAVPVRELELPQPQPEESAALLEERSPETGRLRQTGWRKLARSALKGRDCFGCLFENEPVALPGARDSTLLRYVGEVVRLLHGAGGDGNGTAATTPEHIYALFLPAVEQLEPDAGTRDWTRVLWRDVLYCWARQEQQVEQARADAAADASDALGLLDRVVAGMREWCEHPDLHGNEGDARAWVAGHLVASSGRTCHVVRPDGRYDSMPVPRELLLARVRALGMEPLIPVKVPSGQGWKVASPSDVVALHGTAVATVRGEPSTRRGGRIERIDEQDAELVVDLFARRDDLEPTYHAAVDKWLRLLFGERYDEAANWIGWALAIEEGPIAALSICGPPSVGKKMLTRGVAECFTYECAASAQDLVGEYQPALRRTPLLVVDEGWPTAKASRHAADAFRELVGGGEQWVNNKWEAHMRVCNPVRIVFTANNVDVVKMLTGGRDLSPEDREALAIRLLHFDVDDRAALWLRRVGGLELTRGWIRGDGGEPSSYVAAKHFLWLHEHARQARGSRLLVEGRHNFALMSQMRTGSGSAPFVVECLVKMLDCKRKLPGLTIEDGKVFVRTAEVLEFFRTYLAPHCSEKLTSNKIGTVLKGLSVSESRPRRLRTRPDEGQVRWHEVDPELLLDAAEREGWRADRLRVVVTDRLKKAAIEKAKKRARGR